MCLEMFTGAYIREKAGGLRMMLNLMYFFLFFAYAEFSLLPQKWSQEVVVEKCLAVKNLVGRFSHINGNISSC